MSDTGYISLPEPKPTPIVVRVVEKTTRSLPLQKLDIQSLEEPEEDVLTDAFQTMVEEAAQEYLTKQFQEMVDKEGDDIDPPQHGDPAVEQLIDAVIDDDGGYISSEEHINPNLVPTSPIGEGLMVSDEEDIFEGEDPYNTDTDIDPIAAFSNNKSHIAQANEENMKDESYTGQQAGAKQASEKGTLDFLRSVEGRVLTVLEAALPDKEHRNAVKTLIKKEFRREMNRVNRVGSEEE